MSDTPEADNEAKRIRDDKNIFVVDELAAFADFARKLERERNELRATLAESNATVKSLHELMVDAEERGVRKSEQEVRELYAEVDRLKSQSCEQNRCMNQLRELWKHLPDIENKYDERLAYHLDELIERLKADKARLDWLEGLHPESKYWFVVSDSLNIRGAIDAAMKGAE